MNTISVTAKAPSTAAVPNHTTKKMSGGPDRSKYLKKMRKRRLEELREKLLGVKGIGPETADSILLYGLKKPVFVVDAYTKRILSRHSIISEKASYDDVQSLFMDHLPVDEKLFNEYHALFVQLGKMVCKKIPRCDICPLKGVRCETSGVR